MTTPAVLHPAGDRPLGFLLSLTAGAVDTAGFVALYGIFTAHVTGNFVLAGAALAHHEAGLGVRLAMFPVFALSVAIGAWIDHRVRRAGASAFRRLLLAEAAALLAFLLAGLRWGQDLRGGILQPEVAWLGAIGVFAMGLQNVLMRMEGPSLPASTVMTGNFTGLIADLTLYALESDPATRAQSARRLERTWPSVVGFLGGSVLGAVGIVHAGFGVLALPLAIVLALALTARPRAPAS